MEAGGSAQDLIELGAVEFVGSKPTGRGLHFYVRPHTPLPLEVMARTGLSPEFLDDKPSFKQIASEVLTFLAAADVIVFDQAGSVAIA